MVVIGTEVVVARFSEVVIEVFGKTTKLLACLGERGYSGNVTKGVDLREYRFLETRCFR